MIAALKSFAEENGFSIELAAVPGIPMEEILANQFDVYMVRSDLIISGGTTPLEAGRWVIGLYHGPDPGPDPKLPAFLVQAFQAAIAGVPGAFIEMDI